MKRYRQWYAGDGDMMEDPHGDYVEYEYLLDIAERLEKLKLFLREDPKYVYEQLTEIINEIRGKE